MKILIVNDNNVDNVNGVVTTFNETIKVLKKNGYEVVMVTPKQFRTIPCPGYKEVRLAINPWKMDDIIEKENPDYIHVATEGPLGIHTVAHCEMRGLAFSSSFHTKTPEYIKARLKWFPLSWGYWFLRRLHESSSRVLVTTDSMKQELTAKKFDNQIVVWGRGVDTELFNGKTRRLAKLPRLLYVGRVSKEKNIEEFLKVNIVAEKIVVGDGPQREELEKKYPDVKFVGYKHGAELADYYANAEVFVFPSYTDTFGIVLLEAMACGTPVAAHNVTGPRDCIVNGISGIMADNLEEAITNCLMLNRDKVLEQGQQHTWDKCTAIFQQNLVKARI